MHLSRELARAFPRERAPARERTRPATYTHFSLAAA